ncbi:hypothetical protein ES705_11523 [subsurface metagenome]
MIMNIGTITRFLCEIGLTDIQTKKILLIMK